MRYGVGLLSAGAIAAFVPTPAQNVTAQDVFDIAAYRMTFK